MSELKRILAGYKPHVQTWYLWILSDCLTLFGIVRQSIMQLKIKYLTWLLTIMIGWDLSLHLIESINGAMPRVLVYYYDYSVIPIHYVGYDTFWSVYWGAGFAITIITGNYYRNSKE